MRSFQEIQSTWQSVCSRDKEVLSLLKEKLSPLLNHPEDDFVKQGMELLTQFGSCSLVFILEQREGTLEVQKKYSQNMGSVESCVMEEVIKEDSDWFSLYEEGSFDGMLLRSMKNTEWKELSNSLQQRVLREVQGMEKIEQGTFLMGALDDDEEALDAEKPRHEVKLTGLGNIKTVRMLIRIM